MYEVRRRAVQQQETYRAVGEVLNKVAALRGRAEAEPAGGLTMWDGALAQMAVADDLLSRGRPNASPAGPRRQGPAPPWNGAGPTPTAAPATPRPRTGWSPRWRRIQRGDFSLRLDPRRTDREYAAAFRPFGLDLDAMNARDFGTALKGRPAAIEVAAALDIWCYLDPSLKPRPDNSQCRKLIEAAQTADPDPWRNGLRDICLRLSLEASAESGPSVPTRGGQDVEDDGGRCPHSGTSARP